MMKMFLSIAGVFLGGVGAYWQVHSGPGVDVTTMTYWVSALMAGVIPLGSYLLGLAQKPPWQDQK